MVHKAGNYVYYKSPIDNKGRPLLYPEGVLTNWYTKEMGEMVQVQFNVDLEDNTPLIIGYSPETKQIEQLLRLTDVKDFWDLKMGYFPKEQMYYYRTTFYENTQLNRYTAKQIHS